jgi:hypothetical protein
MFTIIKLWTLDFVGLALMMGLVLGPLALGSMSAGGIQFTADVSGISVPTALAALAR